MEIRKVFKEQYQDVFVKGIESKKEEIKEMGWTAARDKFNLDNPREQNNRSMDAIYFSKGEMEALLMASR